MLVEVLLLVELELARGKLEARKLRHRLNDLSTKALDLATTPSAKTARYLPRVTPGHRLYNEWRETLRYRAPGTLNPQVAREWLAEAKAVYESTIVPMRLDGVI